MELIGELGSASNAGIQYPERAMATRHAIKPMPPMTENATIKPKRIADMARAYAPAAQLRDAR